MEPEPDPESQPEMEIQEFIRHQLMFISFYMIGLMCWDFLKMAYRFIKKRPQLQYSGFDSDQSETYQESENGSENGSESEPSSGSETESESESESKDNNTELETETDFEFEETDSESESDDIQDIDYVQPSSYPFKLRKRKRNTI
jgi:hypothetical protein